MQTHTYTHTHTHTHNDHWSRVAQNLISFLSGGKWLHKQYVNITEPLCRLTQTTGMPSRAGLLQRCLPHWKEINTFYYHAGLTMWKHDHISYYNTDSDPQRLCVRTTLVIFWLSASIKLSKSAFFFLPSVGHNLAEVVSVHAYLCFKKASLMWVGEASLEYVQDDAQVVNNPGF